MTDIIVPGMAALERVERIYGNRGEYFSSGGLSGVDGIGKTGASFREYMENAIQRETAVFTEGRDVVMSCPPLCYTNYRVDMNKPREEMTLDEYKQYICNYVSSLPVSDSRKMCGSGVLIFKEEALESMKKDPAYEQEVIHMLGENFSKQLAAYEPRVEYQVIGEAKEECYGASIPLKNYGWVMGTQGGLASSLLSSAGLSGLGLSSGLFSSGLLSSGLSGYGLLSGGLASTGLPTLGVSRANMVNAYKNTLKNRNNNGRTRLSGRR